MSSNNAIIFTKAPTEFPVVGEHLKYEKRDYSLPEPSQGEIITENIYVSIDPYQRGRMRNPEVKSYSPPYNLNEPVRNFGVAKVYKSKNEKFSVGDLVFLRNCEWAEYTLFKAEETEGINKLQNPYKLSLSNFIGVLGMPGMTAYSSLYEIGKPKKGETIFISAASGAVGQLVGQLAKREGLIVVGSAGTDEKVKHLKDLKFDEAFNYKKERPADALAKYCPNGIDIYFENVGGETLDAALAAANNFARFIVCGMISNYNTREHYGVKNMMMVVAKRLLLRGFIVGDPDFWPKYQTEFYTNVMKWMSSGELRYQEDIAPTLEDGPAKFVGMLRGENFGKAMIQIRAEHI